MIEEFFTCPYCWSHISILLDSTQQELEMIEDCEVCCNPFEITAIFENTKLINAYITSIEQ